MPIRSPQGRMLGALAMYLREPRTPIAVRAARHRDGDAARRHRRRSRACGGIAAPVRGELPLVRRELADRHLSRDGHRPSARRERVARPAARLRLVARAAAGPRWPTSCSRNLVDRDRLCASLQAHGELRSADMEWRRKDGIDASPCASARARIATSADRCGSRKDSSRT